MKKIKKKIVFGLLSIFFVSSALSANVNQVNAEEIDANKIYNPSRGIYALTFGNVKVLNVRLGFPNYPADNTNHLYEKYNNEYLRSIFEGKEDGFGLPYNGVADYLETSSYGNLSMCMGEIIDIQMDEPIGHYADDGGYINFYEIDEFVSKLYSEIDVSEYDINKDNAIDAMYIWNLCDDEWYQSSGEWGAYTWGKTFYDEDVYRGFVFSSFPDEVLSDDKNVINAIIHETGHLLLCLDDYYLFKDYPLPDGRADIGNIMGWAADGEMGDFDAHSKWIAEWISDDNVIGIKPNDGDNEIIELTPYDSDTSEGKKIALFEYGDGCVVVEYCGGLNNNDFNTSQRNSGFRFYIIPNYNTYENKSVYHEYDPNLAPEGIYLSAEELGAYQLFSEGDEIEDLLLDDLHKTLKIYNINTGDNPSFQFEYHDAAAAFNKLKYLFEIEDEERNVLTSDSEISVECTMYDYDGSELGLNPAYKEDLYYDDYARYESHNGGNPIIFDIQYDKEKVSEIDMVIKVNSLPDGYAEVPDIRLKYKNGILENIGSDDDYYKIKKNNNFDYDTFAVILTVPIKEEDPTGPGEDPTGPGEDPTGPGEDPTGSGEDPTGPGEDPTGPGEDPTGSGEDPTGPGEAPAGPGNYPADPGKEPNTVPSTEPVAEPTEKYPKHATEASKPDNSTTQILNSAPNSPAVNLQANTVVTPITPANNTSPKTGDKNLTPVWITVAGASAGVLGTALVIRRKKKI